MLPSNQPAADAPRYQQLLWRFRHLWPLFSLSAGLASFLLIERREAMARWLAVLLLAGWALILTENVLVRWISGYRRSWGRASPWLLRFATQGIHQETFFFTLPFLLHTTTWTSPQAVFTLGVCAAAIVSSWDPVYYGRVAERSGRFLAFHAFAAYVALLVMLPMLLHLTTRQTLVLSSAAMAVLAVPSVAAVVAPKGLRQWMLALGGALLLGAMAWWGRAYVPPATLWIPRAVISHSVDVATREPGVPVAHIPEDELRQRGLYAFSAIRAPRGLKEQVFHRWIHEGQEVDRIPLVVQGGRQDGYRAWTHKQVFPTPATGHWRVEVVTESGQLIGLVRFRVYARP